APMPGSNTPSCPFAGLMSRPFPASDMQTPLGRASCCSRKRASVPRPTHSAHGFSGTGSGLDGGKASGGGEKGEGRLLQLVVVPRAHEASFAEVVVEDTRALQPLVGLERIEHEDAAIPGKPVVEEAEVQVTHRPLMNCISLCSAPAA